MAWHINAKNRILLPKVAIFYIGVFILEITSLSFSFPGFYWPLGKAYSFGANGHQEAHVSCGEFQGYLSSCQGTLPLMGYLLTLSP